MPKKKDPPEDPKEQHKRFKEAAREHDFREDENLLEKAFGRIVPPVQGGSKPD